MFNLVWGFQRSLRPLVKMRSTIFDLGKEKMLDNSNPQMKFYIKNELLEICREENKMLWSKKSCYISKTVLPVVRKGVLAFSFTPLAHMFWENVLVQINKKYTDYPNICDIWTWSKMSHLPLKTILAVWIHSLGPLETFVSQGWFSVECLFRLKIVNFE